MYGRSFTIRTNFAFIDKGSEGPSAKTLCVCPSAALSKSREVFFFGLAHDEEVAN